MSEIAWRSLFDGSIQTQFEEFHRDNPEVYEFLVRFARQAKDAGRQRVGIGMLWERLRWEVYLRTYIPDEEWKLNNNFRARYARLIMEQEPDLAGIFETRRLRAL